MSGRANRVVLVRVASVAALMLIGLSQNGKAEFPDSTRTGALYLDDTAAAPWLDVLFPEDITYDWSLVSIRMDSDWVLPTLIKVSEDRYLRPPISFRQRGIDESGRKLCILGWSEVDLERYIDDRGWPECECVTACYVAVLAIGVSDTEVVILDEVNRHGENRGRSIRREVWGGGLCDVDLVILGSDSSRFVRVDYGWSSQGVSGGSHGASAEFLLLDLDKRQLTSMQSMETGYDHWNRHSPNVDSRITCSVMDVDSDGDNEIVFSRSKDLHWNGITSTFSDPGRIVIEKLEHLLYRDRIVGARGESRDIQNKLPLWVIPLPDESMVDTLDGELHLALDDIETEIAYKYSFTTLPQERNDSSRAVPEVRIYCRASRDSLYVFVTSDRELTHRICVNPLSGFGSEASRFVEFAAAGPDSIKSSVWTGVNASSKLVRTLSNYSWPHALNKYDPPEFMIALSLEEVGLNQRDSSLPVCAFAHFVYRNSGVSPKSSWDYIASYPAGATPENFASWGVLTVARREDRVGY